MNKTMRMWRHIREVYKTLRGIARDFGPIGKDAVWSYTPSEELRNGDFIEDYRLIQALLKGVSPDFDVYDAASWSVVSELSEKSVANRSRPVDFPDFTEGRWKTNRPVEIMGV